MKPIKNRWKHLINHLNQFKNGSTITRKELIKVNSYAFGDFLQFFSKEMTIDVYRRYLTKAGFLKHTGRGIYEKVKDIPADISKRAVLRIAYNPEKVKRW